MFQSEIDTNKLNKYFRRISLAIGISLIFFKVSAYGDTIFQAKITDEKVKILEQVLSSNPTITNSHSYNESEDLFRARTAAHRLRLSQIFLEVSKDKELIKKNPEFKPLFDDPQKTLQVLLEHDAGKSMGKTKNAIRVLSMLQGVDVSNPKPGVPTDVDQLIRSTLKEAIDDINVSDKIHMKETFNKVSPNPQWTKLHESMTDALDFYDTYKSRQAEIAGDSGRKLAPPSEWIDKLNQGKELSEEQLKETELKKKLAKHLEIKDPLKNPSAFAKTEQFLGGKSSQFLKEASQLLNPSTLGSATKGVAVEAVKLGKAGFKTVGKSGGVGAAVVGLEYVIDPESVNASTLADKFDWGNLSQCSSPECNRFLVECAKKINKESKKNQNQLIKTSQFEMCLKDFFNEPLQEQSKLREDGDLNRILSETSPRILNLSCKDANVIEVETMDSQAAITKQTVSFSTTGKQLRSKWINEKYTANYLTGEPGSDHLLQYCEKGKGCENYSLPKVHSVKPFPWLNKMYPLESFQWVKSQEKVSKYQSKAIFECCQINQCKAYFEKQESSAEVRKVRSRGIPINTKQ